MGIFKYRCDLYRHRDYIICCMSRMNEWIELIFRILKSVRKAKSYYGYAYGQIWLWSFLSWDSKMCFISRINWWTTVIIVPMKCRIKTKINSWGKVFHVSLTTKQHYIFFVKKHFNKQHQPDIWFKEQQFLVLKGVKRKIVNGSLAE